jgi:hypothetical protein
MSEPINSKRKPERRDDSHISLVADSKDVCSQCRHARAFHSRGNRFTKDGCDMHGCTCDHFVPE